MDSSELISWSIPTYRISDLEIKEIFAPMNSVMAEGETGREGEEEDGDASEDNRWTVLHFCTEKPCPK